MHNKYFVVHVSGIMMFFRGLGNVVGPFVVGTIVDLTNSYEYACYMAVGCLLLGAFLNQMSYFVWARKVVSGNDTVPPFMK